MKFFFLIGFFVLWGDFNLFAGSCNNQQLKKGKLGKFNDRQIQIQKAINYFDEVRWPLIENLIKSLSESGSQLVDYDRQIEFVDRCVVVRVMLESSSGSKLTLVESYSEEFLRAMRPQLKCK